MELEQIKTSVRGGRRNGTSLILSVFILSFVVLLVGMGRLAAYRNQVQLRLDREREIQQELATRSAVRWLETHSDKLPAQDVESEYETARGPMSVVIQPADSVFPIAGNPKHWNFKDAQSPSAKVTSNRYTKHNLKSSDYHTSAEDGYQKTGWYLSDEYSQTGSCHWVCFDLTTNDVPGLLWTDDPYGRRYLLKILNTCKAGAAEEGIARGDVIRLGITPRNEALFNRDGSNDKLATYGLWVEQQVETTGAEEKSSRVSLCSMKRTGGIEKTTRNTIEESLQADLPLGIQIAGRYVMAVKQENYENKDATFWTTITYPDEPWELEGGFLDLLSAACLANGGVRLTVEVEVTRNRPAIDPEKSTEVDMYRTVLSTVSITPAYEFSTKLGWCTEDADGNPVETNEVSTVIGYRKIKGSRNTGKATTYDTHGTLMTRKKQIRK